MSDSISDEMFDTTGVGAPQPTPFAGHDFSKPRFVVLEESGGALLQLSVSETEKAAIANLRVLAQPFGVYHLVVTRLMNIRPRIEATAPKVKLDGERARVRRVRTPKAPGEASAPKVKAPRKGAK